MRNPLLGLVTGLSLLWSSGVAAGAGLAIDGQVSVTRIMGETITLSVTGAPGKPVTLLADVLPGPSLLFGQLLPLGFSPLTQVIPLGSLDPAGTLAVPAVLPTIASLDGQTLYLLAVVQDDASPIGLDFSNGADITLEAPPLVGADQATLVGRRVLLDGGAAAQPSGVAKPGTTVSWTLTSAPSGSAATIADANQPFATLVPDLPGDYVAQMQVNTATASYLSSAVVHAWRVDTAPVSDGGVLVLSNYGVTGTVVGPPVQSLTFDGQPIAVGGNGAFGPVQVAIPAGEAGQQLKFRLTHPDGTTANHHMTVFQGLPQPFSTPSSKSLQARLRATGLNQVAALGEETLEAVDLKSILLALPPQQVANETGPFGITLFSATIKFKNLTYNHDMQLTLVPTPSGIVGTVTITNIKADFNVYGEVIEIDYDLDGYITTSPTTITATLVGSAQNGKLKVAVNNVVVNRANFDFELTGFIGTVAEAFVIESSVKEQVEATIADAVKTELGAGVEEILNSFVLAGSLASVLDVDVSIAAPISGVVHDAGGVTIQLDSQATVGVVEPGSPAITAYRGTPVLPPFFPSLTPSGQGYSAGLAIADDFVNQILAAGTRAGLMDGDLTSLFPTSGTTPVNLPTDQLALIFPGSGFDHFADGTPVRLQAHGTVSPLLCLTPGQPSMGTLRMDNLEVEFEVDTAYGALPMLLVSVNGLADVDVSAGLDGTLELDLKASDLSLEVLRIFPGASPTTMDQQVGFLSQIFNFALPDLVGALGAIPVPSLEASGLGLSTQDAGLMGGGYFGLFGDLVVLPGN